MKKTTFQSTALSKATSILNIVLGSIFTLGFLAGTLALLMNFFSEPTEIHPAAIVLPILFLFHLFIGIGTLVSGIRIYKKQKRGLHQGIIFNILLIPSIFNLVDLWLLDFIFSLLFTLPSIIIIVFISLILKGEQKNIKNKTL